MSQEVERTAQDDSDSLKAVKAVRFVLRNVSLIRELSEVVGGEFEEVRGCDVDICYFVTDVIIPSDYFDPNAELLGRRLAVSYDC